MTENEALKQFIPILGRISTPYERGYITHSITERIAGRACDIIMAITHKQAGALAWPNDSLRAHQFELALDAATDSCEFVSIIQIKRRLRIEELASWPNCPAIAPDSPLVYWLGAPAPAGETKEQHSLIDDELEYSGLTESEKRARRTRAINRATQSKWDSIKNDLADRRYQHTEHLHNEWQEKLAPAPPPRVEPLTAPATADSISIPTKRGVIELPAGTKHVRFEKLPHLIAYALWPVSEESGDGQIFRYGQAETTIRNELEQEVELGTLPVKNPRTFGPYMPHHPGGVRLVDCVVQVVDLRQYVAKRGLSVEVQEEDRKPRSKKITWRDVSLDYVLTVLAESKATTAKSLFGVLERKAGHDSPFDKGTGDNRGSLIVRKINEPLSLKTLQNAWAEIKAGTPKG